MRTRGLTPLFNILSLSLSLVACAVTLTSCSRSNSDLDGPNTKKPTGTPTDDPGEFLTISPSDVTLAVKNQISFQVSGGTPPYSYHIGEGGNGTIDMRSGLYTASDRPGSTKIRVRDTKGNFGEAYVTINPPLRFGTESRNVGLGEQTLITAQNGVAPYRFQIVDGAGSIDEKTGTLRAPLKPGKIKIRISDSRGNVIDAEYGAVVSNKIALGLRHTCALLEDGSVKCWGKNKFGQLGAGDRVTRGSAVDTNVVNLPAVNLGTMDGLPTGRPIKAVSVVSGRNHACALLENNRVKCWGRNFYGNLGIGSRSRQGDNGDPIKGNTGNSMIAIDFGKDAYGNARKALGLAAGENFTCALMDDLRVKCVGSNFFGQSGTSSKDWFWGDSKGELGEKLKDVDLGKNPQTGLPYQVIGVSAGRHHACALIIDGRVKCWGANFYGQLGYGDRNLRGNKAKEMGDALPFVDLGAGRTVTQLALGNFYSCALLDNASVKCWGSNLYGQAAAGGGFFLWNKPWIGTSSKHMGDNLKPVDLGTSNGQDPVRVRYIAAGDQQVCVITETRSIKCWGRNHKLQLGSLDGKNRGRDPEKMGNNLPEVNLLNQGIPSQIALGRRHTCVLLDDRALSCWGFKQAPRQDRSFADSLLASTFLTKSVAASSLSPAASGAEADLAAQRIESTEQAHEEDSDELEADLEDGTLNVDEAEVAEESSV